MIKFKERQIEFTEYPFTAASVYPDGILHANDIKEVLLKQMPPEVRTIGGEIIFVNATYKEQLEAFADYNVIPKVSRIDTWGLILDGFLDTEFSEEIKEKALKSLESCGITREECIAIRNSLKDLMIAYNFMSMLWDWVHIGHFDLLHAYNGELTGHKFKLGQEEFKEVYWETMKIGNKGMLRV
ncbi:hypothetical protein [Gorillibacterium sp. sgz5001074]|uniref:hypothetical protein n=1 Tax=Gorillibacterium sp. sgz5001074 TaxID=3446695 RepID=UPI003F6699A4